MRKISKERAEEIDAAWQAATPTERLRLPRMSWLSVGDDIDYYEENPPKLELDAADRIEALELALHDIHVMALEAIGDEAPGLANDVLERIAVARASVVAN